MYERIPVLGATSTTGERWNGKMERKYREERVKDISKCVDCHPTGREHRNSPPKKSELLTQRAPSVATGKAIDGIA